MLILSRFKDESIRIGDTVRITVVEVVGGKVKLGFEAPTEIPIHREEVWLAINDVLNEQFEEEKP
jgi:carbon storage regulator